MLQVDVDLEDLADGTIMLHDRGRCVGVWRGGGVFTHNMSLFGARARNFTPVERTEVPEALHGLLAAAERRAAKRAPEPRPVSGRRPSGEGEPC